MHVMYSGLNWIGPIPYRALILAAFYNQRIPLSASQSVRAPLKNQDISQHFGSTTRRFDTLLRGPSSHVSNFKEMSPSTEAVSCIERKKGLSPRANYTNLATAACQRRWCQLLHIESATWSAQRIPMAVFSVF
jgi:hypothetical protein